MHHRASNIASLKIFVFFSFSNVGNHVMSRRATPGNMSNVNNFSINLMLIPDVVVESVENRLPNTEC